MFRIIFPNTWYVDHHGTPCKILRSTHNKVHYIRKGRTCIASMFRFNHDFEPVNKADADRIAEEIETAEHIKKLRDMRSKSRGNHGIIQLTLDEACQFLKISRPTATNWIRTGRLQATRKDPTKPKSPYLTTRQACIAALQSPLHTVQVSAGDGITEERKCHSSAEMKYGMPRIRSRAGNELRNLLAQRTSGKLRSCTTSEKQNSGE
ncbi:TPA: DUF4222 domain-containing protein [Escherichia coli]|nr:DUF4222 domain-containing protein [Escherichia coli]HAM4011999.1 DUF4222 domain-containing protein [Escherichia coli]